MAKYTITRSCGHTETVQIAGPVAGRDRQAEYEAGKLCHECWQADQIKRRDAESQAAAESAKASGLPALTGTEKQIAWAESIRAKKFQALDELIRCAESDPDNAKGLEVFRRGVDAVKSVAAAHWWIEQRDASLWWGPREFFVFLLGGEKYLTQKATDAELIARAAAYLGGLAPSMDTEMPAEIVADAKAEATVRPESPNTDTVAELLIAGQELHITFPEKRDDFRDLVKKQLGMTWAEGYWKRLIGSMAGDIDDRLAEAGHRLLAAGFVIRIYDPILRARAIAGEFAAEHTRWITRRSQGAKTGWFCLVWGRDEDYYAPARKLPGSRYDKPYVVAPPEQFEEVLDFAGRYDFRLTASGHELAEQARVNRDAALVAKVEAKPKTKGQRITQADKPEAMPAPVAEVEVDNALRDE